LAVLQGSRLIRVEVTTGYVTPNGSVQHPTRDTAKFDLLAVVKHDGAIVYAPTIESLLSVG
jgi:hypothetical protein